ncbi:MAG: TRAP transporter small permease [Desulfobacterales bacterium]|nr:TRAP transporter small permease [Desulfobacterales bacterium]
MLNNQCEKDNVLCTLTASSKSSGLLHQAMSWLSRIDEFLVAALLLAMIALVLAQIFLRNALHQGMIGGDSMIRHLLLWIVFLGASLSTKENTHIKMDALSKILPESLRLPVECMTDVFSIVVGSILVYASVDFVYTEYIGQSNMPFMNMPLWIFQSIIPIGYGIITLRFLAKCIRNILCKIKRN